MLTTHFTDAAKAAGCSADQFLNFSKAGLIPQARQLAASAADRPKWWQTPKNCNIL